MSLTVIGIVNYPTIIRGMLQRKALEIRAHTFVAVLDPARRNSLWKALEKHQQADSEAYMVYQDRRNPAGFVVKTLGVNRRQVIDNCGLPLVRYRLNFNKSD